MAVKHCPACGTPLKQPPKPPEGPIAERRAELGLSLQQVANLAGITKAQVWEIERRKSNPRMNTLLGLARALQWPVETLVERLNAVPIPMDRGGEG